MRVADNSQGRFRSAEIDRLPVFDHVLMAGVTDVGRPSPTTSEDNEMDSSPTSPAQGYLRIATEEAFAPIEVLDEYRRLLDHGGGDKGFASLWGYYLLNPSPHTRGLVERIQDLSERRLGDMRRLWIDHQVVSLTCPGVELFDLPRARDLARLTNDRIAAACQAHPERFSGLVAVALQDLEFSIAELERGVRELGLRGVIVNSHARGVYLDDPRFEPLFAAVEALDVPLYLHPNTPSDGMIGPLLESGLDGAIYGFAVETGMHLIRIIFSGVFDRYPKLRLVVGHLGEALPFWLFRIDHFHAVQERSGRYPWRAELEHTPSDYLRRNVWLTTSGMAWEPAIMFSRQVVGADRVLYAMDYPYQAFATEVEAQDQLPITAEEKRTFFETGARELFRLALGDGVTTAESASDGRTSPSSQNAAISDTRA
jgi:5-carboxyvanillate decarboxylase